MRPSKIILACIVGLSLILITSCKKDDPPTPPIVKTSTITDITQTTAIGGGQIEDNGGKPITSRGVCWGTTNSPTVADSKTIDGAGDGSFVSNLDGLAPGNLYYVRAYAINGVGTGYGDPVSFRTSAVTQAQITTNAVTEITSTSAKSGGTIVSDGGGDITACGVCWSTNHEPKTSDNITTDVLNGTSFTSTLTNLEYFTAYYVRAYATNSAGTVYGNEREFSTSAVPPTVTTSEVTNRGYTSATVGGEVIDDGGISVTDRGICYSTHSDPKVNENNMPSGSGLGTFSVDITGLEPNTIYHVRAYAATAADTAYGTDVEFATLELGVPEVTTKSPGEYVDLLEFAMTGGDVISDGGSNVTERGVCWSINEEPTTNDMHRASGSGLGSFDCIISPEEKCLPAIYYVRAYATNSTGTGYGNQVSFSTICSHLYMEEFMVGQITGTSVLLSIVAGGVDIVRFEITNTSTGSTQTVNANGGGPCFLSVWEAYVTGLTMGQEYSVTANADGFCPPTPSDPIKFTTLNVPTLTTTAASEITSNAAMSGGDITSDGGSSVTERGVCWSTTEIPTISDDHISSGGGVGVFTIAITELEANTSYYARAYAINSIGINYGPQVNFKTDPYEVGQSYGGGIVFYVDGTGKHGLIAAPNNYSYDKVWSNPWMPEVVGASGTAIGTGLSNTNKIVSAYGSSDYAANACYDLVLNEYDDWFLPSRDELSLLYTNRELIGGFIDLKYWSSTETGMETANSVDFSSGSVSSSIKTVAHKIRPIRSF